MRNENSIGSLISSHIVDFSGNYERIDAEVEPTHHTHDVPGMHVDGTDKRIDYGDDGNFELPEAVSGSIVLMTMMFVWAVDLYRRSMGREPMLPR